MFVLASKYQALEARLARTEAARRKLQAEWNALVDEINAKGGRAFLDGTLNEPRLSRGDIGRLILLCHPDKHGGKQMAEDMTKKLLALRNECQEI